MKYENKLIDSQEQYLNFCKSEQNDEKLSD